ncbi:actin filament-associated protein 1 [Elysia marginata]|uniref:Actin filament-associated protein 1 n=1 Tax=Elysia marginata TaxID=1093978 RepID=A0AAV4JY67_9GAST|nr:actin filament-associated protein 1 [Elysia marginata]
MGFSSNTVQKPLKKSSLGSKKSSEPGVSVKKSQRPLSKVWLSTQWAVSVPFKLLDNVDISGEVYHRGKLSWNRRVVALTGGLLAFYKPDKESARPSLVVPLTGYTATVSERESRRGYEVRLTHLSEDCHTFAVDFRDWAHLWAEHINGTASGQPPPKYHTHLARPFSGGDHSAAPPADVKLKHRSRNLAKADLAGYTAASSNELEDLFNAVDSDREEGSINEVPYGKRRGHFLPNRLQRGRTLIPKRFHYSNSQEPLTRGKTLGAFPSQRTPWKAGSNASLREGPGKSIGAAVKDILARRQRGLFKVTQYAHDSDTGLSGVGSYSRKVSDLDTSSDWHSSHGNISKGHFRLMPSSDRAKEASCHQGRRPINSSKLGLTPQGGAKYEQQTHDSSGCLPYDEARDECGPTDQHGCQGSSITEVASAGVSTTHLADVQGPPSSVYANSGSSTLDAESRVLASPQLPLPVARWDWKSLLLAWSSPVDQFLTALKVSPRRLTLPIDSVRFERMGEVSSGVMSAHLAMTTPCPNYNINQYQPYLLPATRGSRRLASYEPGLHLSHDCRMTWQA